MPNENARLGALATLRANEVRTGNSARITQLGLAPHLVARLEAEGVETLDDWKRLGGRRLGIFGITRRVIAFLDAAADREARI